MKVDLSPEEERLISALIVFVLAFLLFSLGTYADDLGQWAGELVFKP